MVHASLAVAATGSVVAATIVSEVAAEVVVPTMVGLGKVRVTVVGVAAQWVQTVTVVVQPSGIDAVVVASPETGLVTPGVAVAVALAAGQTYVVYVVVMVVKPVGQMLV